MPQRARSYTLFVSDLHLSPERPAINRAFGAFLRDQARRAQALYILGDLFDYWIGDDDLCDSFHASIATELANLAGDGRSIFFMPGNRDFLIGTRFAAAARLKILTDPTVIEQAQQRTLLLHGDTLCTGDLDYQAFRAKVHDAAWQRDFLGKPLAQRREIALQLRADSQSSQKAKSAQIMEVAPLTVEQAFRQYGCSRMIHGHTHRPARHEHRVDGRVCERWVLADWYRRGSYLRCDARGACEAMSLPAA